MIRASTASGSTAFPCWAAWTAWRWWLGGTALAVFSSQPRGCATEARGTAAQRRASGATDPGRAATELQRFAARPGGSPPHGRERGQSVPPGYDPGWLRRDREPERSAIRV